MLLLTLGPMTEISKNTHLTDIHDFMFDVVVLIGTGNSTVSSVSKVVMIIAISNKAHNARRT